MPVRVGEIARVAAPEHLLRPLQRRAPAAAPARRPRRPRPRCRSSAPASPPRCRAPPAAACMSAARSSIPNSASTCPASWMKTTPFGALRRLPAERGVERPRPPEVGDPERDQRDRLRKHRRPPFPRALTPGSHHRPVGPLRHPQPLRRRARRRAPARSRSSRPARRAPRPPRYSAARRPASRCAATSSSSSTGAAPKASATARALASTSADQQRLLLAGRAEPRRASPSPA